MSGLSGATIGSATTPRPVQVRQLNADIQGSLCRDIASASRHTDAVIVDLFDERFGVDLLWDGTYITRSPERVQHVPVGSGTRRVAFGSDEHFELWRAAADRFVAFLASNGLLARTFLLDVAWAHSDENGRDAELPFGLTSAEANTAFARYVEHLRLSGVKVLSHSNTWTSRVHRWGPAPYNFHDDVYAAIAAKLKLVLGDAADGDPRAMSEGSETTEWDSRHDAPVIRWNAAGQFDARLAGRVHHVVAPGEGQAIILAMPHPEQRLGHIVGRQPWCSASTKIQSAEIRVACLSPQSGGELDVPGRHGPRTVRRPGVGLVHGQRRGRSFKPLCRASLPSG